LSLHRDVQATAVLERRLRLYYGIRASVRIISEVAVRQTQQRLTVVRIISSALLRYFVSQCLLIQYIRIAGLRTDICDY